MTLGADAEELADRILQSGEDLERKLIDTPDCRASAGTCQEVEGFGGDIDYPVLVLSSRCHDPGPAPKARN